MNCSILCMDRINSVSHLLSSCVGFQLQDDTIVTGELANIYFLQMQHSWTSRNFSKKDISEVSDIPAEVGKDWKNNSTSSGMVE